MLRGSVCVGLALLLVGWAPQPVEHLKLRDGRAVDVYANGVAAVWSTDRSKIVYRHLIPEPRERNVLEPGMELPPVSSVLTQLEHGAPTTSYAAGEAVVALRRGARIDDLAVSRALKNIGADRSQQLFTQIDPQLLPPTVGSVYRVHFVGASVRDALVRLSQLPTVAYASPNWFVSTMRAASLPIPLDEQAAATGPVEGAATGNIPTNFAVATSAQSLLNAPGVNAITAYDEIGRRFHQLPGEGEIITDVSVGDLTGGGPSSDPCSGTAQANGPTTVLMGGRRYLDLPSMPLIPTYVSDGNGALSASADVCNTTDGTLNEIGLDFSVMAPLPDDRQRSNGRGSGYSDLLGIAPGASYRLVVPGDPAATLADIDSALFAAAMQQPRPDVITASLGFGFDGEGFPDRYLEEDPLTNAIVGTIIAHYRIAVCISANDGLRPTTNAAVAPSGGSAETNRAPDGGIASDLNDVAFSTAPSSVFDSGAIDAGGTTLDDVVSAEPQDPMNAALAMQHGFAVTRWNGMTAFSSGFGSRVDVSAPADNILAMSHKSGGSADAVVMSITGGTSASAPQAAAAAAIALQVARLTDHPFDSPAKLRTFLVDHGSAVPNVPQANVAVHVGQQIDVGEIVEALLRQDGKSVQTSVARVAVEQRQEIADFGGAFVTSTKPADIDLAGPRDSQTRQLTGDNQFAWITIAPDWEGLSSTAQFALLVHGNHGVHIVARKPWARLLPATLFAVAGLPLQATSPRTVKLSYQVRDRGRLVTVPVSLTFGASDGTSESAPPPIVAPVVHDNTLKVSYDLTNVRNVSSPSLFISEPGRVNPSTGYLFRPSYTVALPQRKGTISVPISRLQGDGIYGITLGLRTAPSGGTEVSDFAYTHVDTVLHDRHADAPLLSDAAVSARHIVEIPYGGSFGVAWDVTDIPGATGAMLEISAPGPTSIGSFNPFNNPGGSIRDDNGVDTGSIYFARLPGPRGTMTLDSKRIGLVPTMNHVVRVIPMAGAEVAAEAGDVSTVMMDGIVPSDGGNLQNGYGINAGGSDGFLTSSQITAGGVFLSSAEIFDQSTAKIIATPLSSNQDAYLTIGWGVWGDDIGILATRNLTIPGDPPSATSFTLMNPVASGALGSSWSPPVLKDGVSAIVQSAVSTGTSTAVILSGNAIGSSKIPYKVFSSNLSANTFSPAYNVSAALPKHVNGVPFALGLAYDGGTHTGVVSFASLTASCGAPLLAHVNLLSGDIKLTNGPGTGFPLDIAIDSTTHTAVYQSQCDNGLQIVHLADGTSISKTLPGTTGLYNAVDPRHGLIAVEMVAAGGDGDNNAMSVIYIYDEHGRLLKTLERFNFFNTGLTVNADNLQLDPVHRVGYMFGPDGFQLEPFSY